MLSKDFREFIDALNSNEVRYLVLGAYALALHGHPRYTKDLDVWIENHPENIVKVLAALDKFGFGSVGISSADLSEGGMVVQLGYPPNRIDLLNSPSGVEFDECFPARMEIEVDGLTIPVIDVENLKKNKRAAGRLQDLADVEALETLNS
ncbi:MAG: DUF6036 family nucleotidyltransferase [Pyrinomonadaceae bacterium]